VCALVCLCCVYSWSLPSPTTLPNNNAGISALRLQSGAVAIAYNNMSGETKGGEESEDAC
jgi:predicted neuraminidase